MIRVLATFGVLMALGGLTFGLSFLPLGRWEVPVAMTIASTKVLVLGYGFMQLGARAASHRLAFLVALALFGTLVALMVLDTASR